MTTYLVHDLRIDEILELRVAVLRNGTPSRSPEYAEDDDPLVRHLGVRHEGVVVACSTWVPRPFPPDESAIAMQLKGMAVASPLQGSGIGRDVLAAGLAHARDMACSLVWARARDSAIGFYERNGFTVVGEEFVDTATGLPHHLVVNKFVNSDVSM